MSVSQILQQMAENAARARFERGAIVGQTVAGLSQVPAQFLADRERERMQRYVLGRQQAQDRMEADTYQRRIRGEDLQTQKEDVLRESIAAGFGGNPDPKAFSVERAGRVAVARGFPELVTTIGKIHEDLLPKYTEYDPSKGLQDPRTGTVIREPVAKPIEVAPGGSLVDPTTRQPIYTAPKPETRSLQQQANDAHARGDVAEYQRLLKVIKETGQADDRPIAIHTAGGLTPTSEAGLIRQWSEQWRESSKPAREIDRQVALMDAGMAAARRGDLAQGAQTVLVTFQKILDPPSVVRESEYMRSAAGQSLLNRIQGYVEQLQKGGAGISIKELEKFYALAKEAATAQQGGYLTAEKERIGRNADRYKIPRELVFESIIPAASGPFIVTDPNGGVHTFDTQAQADEFKRRAGIR